MSKRVRNRQRRNKYLIEKGLLIDDTDWHILENRTFIIDHKGYLRTYINSKPAKLHHLIVGKPPGGKVTDHINRNKLDNRRSNLRFVSYSESNLNRERRKPKEVRL